MMMAAVSMIDESDEDVISCSFCLCYIGDSDDQKPKFLSCKHAICIDCERVIDLSLYYTIIPVIMWLKMESITYEL